MTIKLYSWPMSSGTRIAWALEELALPYQYVPLDAKKQEHRSPEMLAVNPHGKVPSLDDGGLKLFESGAILLYLADKIRRFIPSDARARLDCIQWLFWQMANLGPMAGQNHHFGLYAPEKLPYAIDRYVRETGRLYAVLNKKLAKSEFIVGEYTIADMASYPWIRPERQQQNIDDFPHLKRWKEAIQARPATVRAYAKAKEINPSAGVPATAEERNVLFGQSKETVK